MTYHLARNGQQLGTCTREEAAARYARGELLPTDLVWCDGMAEWAAASTVFGAAPTAATPPPMTAATPPATAAPATVGSVTTPEAASVPPKKPESFLIFSILSTVLCCPPFGIVAIVFSAQVDGKYSSGDYAGAEKAAKNARLWTFIAAGVGLVGGLAYAMFVGIAIANSGSL